MTLRLLSWLAYLAGGLVMIRQVMALGQVGTRARVAAIAALLVFCSPYPIPFAIEGKSYAVLLLVVVRRWGGLLCLSWPQTTLLDRSGLMPSLLMVVGVVALSFLKPMAFSRYFVVLLPALVPVLAVQIGALELNRFGRSSALVVLGLMLISWWGAWIFRVRCRRRWCT